MRYILGFVLGLLLLTTPPRADAQETAIQAVISDQFADFLEDDFAGAFAHASPMIRRIFGTPENFGNMVRNGFPMVWRPSEFQFLSNRNDGALYFQDVLIRDAQGRVHILEYEMIKDENGWKINGVRPKNPDPGTA